jgi:hypothetical protein
MLIARNSGLLFELAIGACVGDSSVAGGINHARFVDLRIFEPQRNVAPDGVVNEVYGVWNVADLLLPGA